MTDFATRMRELLAKRYENVKCTFRHARCHQQTTVPVKFAALVQSDPEAFPLLHCVGCMKDVPATELTWS